MPTEKIGPYLSFQIQEHLDEISKAVRSHFDQVMTCTHLEIFTTHDSPLRVLAEHKDAPIAGFTLEEPITYDLEFALWDMLRKRQNYLETNLCRRHAIRHEDWLAVYYELNRRNPGTTHGTILIKWAMTPQAPPARY